MTTPTLDRIACHGNRWYPVFNDASFIREEPNWITCVDGYYLSVVAGWGAYSIPRIFDADQKKFNGPYTHVEVMLGGPVPESWDEYDAGGVCSAVPVPLVRELIESHGGELSAGLVYPGREA